MLKGMISQKMSLSANEPFNLKEFRDSIRTKLSSKAEPSTAPIQLSIATLKLQHKAKREEVNESFVKSGTVLIPNFLSASNRGRSLNSTVSDADRRAQRKVSLLTDQSNKPWVTPTKTDWLETRKWQLPNTECDSQSVAVKASPLSVSNINCDKRSLSVFDSVLLKESNLPVKLSVAKEADSSDLRLSSFARKVERSRERLFEDRLPAKPSSSLQSVFPLATVKRMNRVFEEATTEEFRKLDDE